MTADSPTSPKIDTTVPQTARVWNYWLGGRDNYRVDREAGDQIEAAFPEMVALARASRGFLVRALRYLAAEVGIRQFLDIGTGLPTANNTHEVAQQIAPDSRIVYVDNDPLVLAHARALLTSHPAGATSYLDADLYDSDQILREAARTLEFTKPITLILSGIMGHVPAYDQARAIVNRLVAALPSGSYLVLSDGVNTSEGVIEAARIWNQTAVPQYHLRTPEQIAGYFDGLELVEPGVVSSARWRPDPSPTPPPEVDNYGGVGRKP